MTVKVPTFDGEVSWELYKGHFEAAAEFRMKATNLVVDLRRLAQQSLPNVWKLWNKDLEKYITCLFEGGG